MKLLIIIGAVIGAVIAYRYVERKAAEVLGDLL